MPSTATRSSPRADNPRDIRRRLGLNQQQFWSRVGVTQSGGSRYESGRVMPRPVRELVRLVHVERIDLAQARGEDFRLAGYLRSRKPALYRQLRAELRSGAPRANARPR
ncbi:MAG: helix-turn-helix domain-containing protein [Burkholderiales bacterium]